MEKWTMLSRSMTPSRLSLVLSAILAAYVQPGFAGQAEFYAGGLPSAPVKLEVFSDYQCPSCRTFYMTALRYVLTDYAMKNRVSVVYHDLPLQTHQYSREASRYALAAQRLGREYWLRMTEALYENQALWSQGGQFDAIAARLLGTNDFARLKAILKDPSVDQALESEITLARERQVQSTPTFFLHSKSGVQKVVGGVPYSVLKEYLDRLLMK
jgi:protein-disulfide isomerase